MQNLKELRRRCDLTQIELARRSGVPRSRIQLAEAESLELRSEEQEAIRKALRDGLERTAELLAANPDLLSMTGQSHKQSTERPDDTEGNESSIGIPSADRRT
jgi:transcriptional regulator with XRE-family HTH domain